MSWLETPDRRTQKAQPPFVAVARSAMWWRPLVFNFPVEKSAGRGADNGRLQPLRARVSAGGLRDTDYVAWFHTCRDVACARSRKRSKREPEMQARCVRARTHLTEATRPLRPPSPLPGSGEVCSHLTRSPSPPPSATLTGVKRRAVR